MGLLREQRSFLLALHPSSPRDDTAACCRVLCTGSQLVGKRRRWQPDGGPPGESHFLLLQIPQRAQASLSN